jgi:uncharacterized protein YgfB (UPF0149 family)
VDLQGTVSGHGSHIDLSIDGERYYPVASPHTFPIMKDGYHMIKLRAVDQDDNVDYTPAAWSFTLVGNKDHNNNKDKNNSIDHNDIYNKIEDSEDDVQDTVHNSENRIKKKVEDSEHDVKAKVEDSENDVIKQINALWDWLRDLVAAFAKALGLVAAEEAEEEKK